MNTIERLEFRKADFKHIQAMMHEYAGISLHDGKQELVYSRLIKRVRQLGLGNFSEYCAVLNGDSEEVLHCINAMTTNVTSFFRERHHFEFMSQRLLPESAGGPLRIWSAGCSTGEEPYSIAFTCGSYNSLNTKIVATDLDSVVLNKAASGIYEARDVDGLTELELKNWFMRGKGNKAGLVRVSNLFRDMVEFSQLNLKEDWHHDEPFDAIFCRNVMIYFDSELRSRLIDMFYRTIKPGGYLFLGHSESLLGLSSNFKTVGKTIHQKESAQ